MKPRFYGLVWEVIVWSIRKIISVSFKNYFSVLTRFQYWKIVLDLQNCIIHNLLLFTQCRKMADAVCAIIPFLCNCHFDVIVIFLTFYFLFIFHFALNNPKYHFHINTDVEVDTQIILTKCRLLFYYRGFYTFWGNRIFIVMIFNILSLS